MHINNKLIYFYINYRLINKEFIYLFIDTKYTIEKKSPTIHPLSI